MTELVIVCGCDACSALFTIQLKALDGTPIEDSIPTALSMSETFYPKRNGDYVYDVTVTKDETVRLSSRYRAHLNNAERIEHGRLAPVQIDVHDTYGPTVTEALRALDASFDTWRKSHPHIQG